MINLIAQVSPETRAVIWFPKSVLESQSHHYKSIDYLTNGILTATLLSQPHDANMVLMGENFGSSLLILIAKDIKESEVKSFMNLVKKDFTPENEVLVIDENDFFTKLQKITPAEISSKLKLLK